MSRFDSVLEALITNLTDREKRLLLDKFGVDVSVASNQEILEAFGKVKRETLKQMEREALEKLRDKDSD